MSSSNTNRRRSGNKRSSARRGAQHRLAFSNDPESFDIHSSSSSSHASSSQLNKDSSPRQQAQRTHAKGRDPRATAGNDGVASSKDSTASPDEGLTIARSAPLKLSNSHFKKKTAHRQTQQDMQPPAASGMATPEHRATPELRSSPALNPVSHLSQEVGTSSQLDLGAPRPGHGRTPSVGTPGSASTSALRRNASSVLVTNVDKHGGPRRRRSKNSLRSKSRSQSQSRPVSPTSSVCSDISSVNGKSLTIVLKLGTSSICDPVTHMPMLANLSMLVETICKLKEQGHHVVLVSSGAVGVGLRRLHMPTKPKELAAIQVNIATAPNLR
ncbi:Glutamate 5-kinase [Coemansia guatemalensis]|uniref:Glutamate 5-kinase n=1 Tax=Coemansia guatemalensis TaxID=2761395 RepID=A0A9W8LRT9_9FUNG|nr:Glutamate 5-kinase [Coemansia guatemalensis]